ncbi:MAG: dTDP-4-dehydrorhamnose 3,5-epimerase [Elusimicrobia bacterium]|nr:dTDP-4-dehydrorhamnose 3,5-epimerase [Elusimicrobiota bacterium]
MKALPTKLPGVVVIEPAVFRDDRGFFYEVYRKDRLEQAGVHATFVQDNQSRTVKGGLRGLHMQVRRPQGKLIRAIRGEIFDVAVDVRVGSPTFGQWESFILSDDNMRQLYIPAGFAHGFVATSDLADVEYKCTDYYDPGGELGIRWNDPQIGVRWPISSPILSPKDAVHPFLKEALDRLPRYDAAVR